VTLRVLSLFAGIGGFDLGLERTGGFKTVAFCEIDPFCRRVLAKHWANVPNLGDVRNVTAACLIGRGIIPDVIAAGFPCPDISYAGLGAGLGGERSGLFYEIIRIAREFAEAGHPIELILLENVAALLGRGLGDVLRELAALGFDAEWDCIPASHVGAPHDRDRAWIVAHPVWSERRAQSYHGALGRMGRQQQSVPWDRNWQGALRELRGMDDGSAYRVDRVDTLRNAVVPQIPELIGRAILASLAERQEAA
jgi:DNA (cytosine-5)-methyltransferase 1